MYPGEIEDRRILADRDTTLDGTPAAIRGYLNSYATIGALPDGPSVNYSWAAVKRIVDATPAHTPAAFQS